MRGMRIYTGQNVYEASKERLRRLFRTFNDITVSVSGGKDSEIALYITLEVAKEFGREINIMFVDEEFDWMGTVEIIRKWCRLDGIKNVFWFQVPITMYNSNSSLMPFVTIWGEERRNTWMREMEDFSIKEAPFKVTRFNELLHGFIDYRTEVTGSTAICITGMRAEESIRRYMGTTSYTCFEDITWGRKNRNSFNFFPFFDWKYSDVWKYICDNDIEYNSVYDKLYKIGVPDSKMRVSNLIHEYTFESAQYVQEVEPETYERLTNALDGISTTSKFNLMDYFPRKLPPMFSSWKEYRDYLLENIIDPQYQDGFRKRWKSDLEGDDRIYRAECIEILKNDLTGTVHKDNTGRVNHKVREERGLVCTKARPLSKS